MVDIQTLANRGLFVVGTDHQILAGHVILAFHFRRVEHHVVGTAGAGVHAATAHALDDLFVRHREFQHEVHHHTGILHGLRLGNGAGEAVQQEAVGAIRLRDTFFDQADDDVVGDELTCVHHGLGLEAQLGARLDRRTQHVAGGDLRNTVFFHDELSLGTFAGTRCSQQNNAHTRS